MERTESSARRRELKLHTNKSNEARSRPVNDEWDDPTRVVSGQTELKSSPTSAPRLNATDKKSWG